MIVDLPAKVRHAVEMACAARALARAAPSDHLKRVLARYAFVHLHDVDRFAAPWRNQLLRDDRTAATARAAEPALERFRRDWREYQQVRHYLAAKRQPRDTVDAARDQLETFELWSDIGELSVETLVDDAFEVYVQLSALEGLPPVDPVPAVSAAAVQAIQIVEPVGDEAYLEVNASTFATARAKTVSLRTGGQPGRIVPLINDVAESATLLAELARVEADLNPAIKRMVSCALPAELDEFLRLAIGPPPSLMRHAPDSSSLLAYYVGEGSPPDVITNLEVLRSSIPDQVREYLHGLRNSIGAHTDERDPWPDLESAMEGVELQRLVELLEWIQVLLELVAVSPGGPILLLLGARRFKSFFEASIPAERGLPYGGASSADVGELTSALPPPEVNSEHVIWVGGPGGSMKTAAVAGMLSTRQREVSARWEQIRRRADGA